MKRNEMVRVKKGLSLMSVPNFRKSYHTVLGAAIDSNGTRIIIIPDGGTLIKTKPTYISISRGQAHYKTIGQTCYRCNGIDIVKTGGIEKVPKMTRIITTLQRIACADRK